MKIKGPKNTRHMGCLSALAHRSGGAFSTAQANEAGFSNERLRLLVQAGVLQRIAHGIYTIPDALPDPMFAMQCHRLGAVYSHETALYLHGLTDRDPVFYSVTVPSGYNAKYLLSDGLTVYTVKRSLHGEGLATMKTAFGNPVRTYTPERTLCDCIRSRNKLDVAVVSDALKRYAQTRGKDLVELMRLAALFRIEKPLRGYLEVLL
ncbi:MAG: type IV toxin-antitoxin system AbiEi family antitoxin domain-containing protein [Verrucomicrobiota bacterium]|jgi:predicted transcriptional regulator of viral defense system|nr:type IV toxin-antitoxin system AbiEi family antitoxin domain-containing protein [Verrucomicrobiota bacterium]